MKILQSIVLLLLMMEVWCVRPPISYCKSVPIPSLVPVSIGETIRLNVQSFFDGYNLSFSSNFSNHITLLPKFQTHTKAFNQSMNFSVAKIGPNNRFLGLSTHGQVSILSIGYNYDDIGVYIQHIVEVEDIPNLHCFDVAEAHDTEASMSYAMVDCGTFENGQLKSNEFLYIDLLNYRPVLGTNEHDTFVHFNHLTKRRVESIYDPVHEINYLLRFLTEDGVDQGHKDQTYVQVFMYAESPLNIKLIEVVDHTFLRLPNLSIADYQVHNDLVYILIKNVGLYQLRLRNSGKIQINAFMEVKQNINRFRVDQLGYNDDLNVVFANDNTVYQYEWDTLSSASLVTKYALMPGSYVEQIFVDYNFVLVQSWAIVDGEYDRRSWVFSRDTTLYTHAFGSFQSPKTGPAIIQWDGHGQTLHIFNQYSASNIRINLPYFRIYPVASQMAGKTEMYQIRATSTEGEKKSQCNEKIQLLYFDKFNTSITKTGLQERTSIYVDSPDERDIPLLLQFFGPNIKYNITFEINSTITPHAYIDKLHEAFFNLPPEIDQTKIIYFDMFTETNYQERKADSIYAIMQVEQSKSELSDPRTYYIHCPVNVFDRDEKHHFNCKILHSEQFHMGRILASSQIYHPQNRLIAMSFETQPTNIYIYYFYSQSFAYYGKKTFNNIFTNRMSDFVINKGLLIVCFEIGKRLQIYKISDLYEPEGQSSNAKPIMVIDHDVMKVFGVYYFAPTNLRASPFHDEAIFVKTKTGIIALNINEAGKPQLLFNQRVSSSYFFEVNRDTLLIITNNSTSLYRLNLPFRLKDAPFLLQKFEGQFYLNDLEVMDSDGLFYVITKGDKIASLHPNMLSTAIFYFQQQFPNIKAINALGLANEKDVVIGFDGKQFRAWVVSVDPYLHIQWAPNQLNFTLGVGAYNSNSTVTSPYKLGFKVLESNEAEIKPTSKFNATEVQGLGHISVDTNVQTIDYNITLNDTQWFEGNILHYNISCKDCHKPNSTIKLQNKVKATEDIVAARAIYDMESTINGIYAQQYDAMFKTWSHNNSIEYTFTIPTQSLGEPCSKLALPLGHEYVLSLCEYGSHVNIYMSILTSFKPFTLGPFRSEAKAVNHAKIVGDVLMIVDNDDDPYLRAGGVYLYIINPDITKPEPISLLDYIGYDDLQIDGYKGIPYLSSADFHQPVFNREEYKLLLTDARTGNIFAFTFDISPDKNQIVYLYKKMISLNAIIPEDMHLPQPIRTITINIVDYRVFITTSGIMRIQYVLLLTVKNWHHIEFILSLDSQNKLEYAHITRLYERVAYPAQLVNYVKLRKEAMNASYFAVTYINKQFQRQAMVVYPMPRFDLPGANQSLKNGIPVTRALGGHRIADPYEVAFAFDHRDDHKMLFVDVDGYNITEIQINRELKVLIQGLKPSNIEPQNLTITAINNYNEFKFQIELDIESNSASERLLLWIIILVIGFGMLIVLVIIWVKQYKNSSGEEPESRQSLLTQGEFKNGENINRSSANPDSLRGTLDTHDRKDANQMTLEKQQHQQQEQQQQEEQEEESGEEDEGEEMDGEDEKKEEIKT